MVSYKTLTEAQRNEYAQKSKVQSMEREKKWKKRHPDKPLVSHCVKDGTSVGTVIRYVY